MNNSDEGKIYFDNDMVLSALYANRENVEETGISFNGEAKIDDNMTIVTDKEIKIDGDIENTHKTYLKVMEMRELTEEELKYANKVREFFSKMYNVLFRGKKWIVVWSIFVSVALGMDIAEGDFLWMFIRIACLAIIDCPVKFIKEVIKMITAGKRREEIEDYLREQHVLGYVDSVDNKADIKMYAKLR